MANKQDIYTQQLCYQYPLKCLYISLLIISFIFQCVVQHCPYLGRRRTRSIHIKQTAVFANQHKTRNTCYLIRFGQCRSCHVSGKKLYTGKLFFYHEVLPFLDILDASTLIPINTISLLSLYSASSAFIAGISFLHGPHQVAQISI